MLKVGISGIMGRMGRKIAEMVLNGENLTLSCGLESPDCVHYHSTVGELLNIDNTAPIVSDLSEVIDKIDVLIEFSSNQEAALGHLRLLAADKKAAVIGTTGFNNSQIEEIRSLATEIPIVLAPNMSIGVNLLFKLVEKAARVLRDKGFDIEVLEMHHRHKKDAPSGTAVKIIDILKQQTGIDKIVYGREGLTGERPSREIGVFALRGGDVVGEHTVIFASNGERIEITHRATSREIFAKGAVEAAKWITNQKPGLYDMIDVLNLDE